jgi:hypothetical protein
MDLESEASLSGIGGKAVEFLHQLHSFTSRHKDKSPLYSLSLLRTSQSLESLFVSTYCFFRVRERQGRDGIGKSSTRLMDQVAFVTRFVRRPKAELFVAASFPFALRAVSFSLRRRGFRISGRREERGAMS